jgi:hypothetical protein
MICQIIKRDNGTNIVLNAKGNPSELYDDILQLVSNYPYTTSELIPTDNIDNLALQYYELSNTPEFRSKYNLTSKLDVEVSIDDIINHIRTEYSFNENVEQGVKEGVEELFDSNPELANEVYEALIGKPEIGKTRLWRVGSEKDDTGIWFTDSIDDLSFYLKERENPVLYYVDVTKEELNKAKASGPDIGENEYQFISERGNKLDDNRIKQITPQQKQQALQLYSQYLDTIFPDSIITDILYRGGEGGISKEQYYTLQKNYAERYGKAIPVILNLPNPVISDKGIHRSWVKDELTDRGIIGKDYPGSTSDAVIEQMNGDEPFSTKGKFDVYVVKNSNQTHELGTKQDIENFAKFVNNSNIGNVEAMQNYMNSKSVDYIMEKLIQSRKIEKKC